MAEVTTKSFIQSVARFFVPPPPPTYREVVATNLNSARLELLATKAAKEKYAASELALERQVLRLTGEYDRLTGVMEIDKMARDAISHGMRQSAVTA